MAKYRKIVLATDGSDVARAAQDVAVALAQKFRATLIVVHAYTRRDHAEPIVSEVVNAASAAGVKTESVMQPVSPAELVVETADRSDADLIVIGNRGLSRAKRFLIGGVSLRVAQQAPCDVLVVHRGRRADGLYGRILVGTDGSQTADRAARKGYEIASKLGGSVTLVFVGHPKTGEIVLKDTHESIGSKVESSFRMFEGDPAEWIIECAEGEGLDLIVVGNRGLTGASRFFLGSVPQKILQYARSDVYVARTSTTALDELKKDEGGVVSIDGRKLAVYRAPDGTLHALAAKCTHLGCTVGWNGADKTWDCPCHGSRFSVAGEVVSGPAAKPLPKADV